MFLTHFIFLCPIIGLIHYPTRGLFFFFRAAAFYHFGGLFPMAVCERYVKVYIFILCVTSLNCVKSDAKLTYTLYIKEKMFE